MNRKRVTTWLDKRRNSAFHIHEALSLNRHLPTLKKKVGIQPILSSLLFSVEEPAFMIIKLRSFAVLEIVLRIRLFMWHDIVVALG